MRLLEEVISSPFLKQIIGLPELCQQEKMAVFPAFFMEFIERIKKKIKNGMNR